MANDFTGRTLKITAPGTIPLANFKIEGGIWSGATAGQIFTITDAAGRQYNITFPTGTQLVNIGKWGWISGPAVITSMPSGEIDLYLGTK